MPKYYRFRARTPVRKIKRKERERDADTERAPEFYTPDRNWLDLTIACTPAPSWYLRRTSWRTSWLPRDFATGLRTWLQMSHRPNIRF